MYTFKHTRDPENDFDISDITFEVETQSRADLVEEFLNFLKACGFSTDNLDLEE